MSKLVSEVMALNEGGRYSVLTMFTRLNDDHVVEVEIGMMQTFATEMYELANELKEVVVKALPYAGYFEMLKVDESIGFADAHFYMNPNVEGEIKMGVYLEVQDKNFYETDLPEKLKDVVSAIIMQVNEMHTKSLN